MMHHIRIVIVTIPHLTQNGEQRLGPYVLQSLMHLFCVVKSFIFIIFECVNNILFPKIQQVFLWWNVSYLIIFWYAYNQHHQIKSWKYFNAVQIIYYQDNTRNIIYIMHPNSLFVRLFKLFIDCRNCFFQQPHILLYMTVHKELVFAIYIITVRCKTSQSVQ